MEINFEQLKFALMLTWLIYVAGVLLNFTLIIAIDFFIRLRINFENNTNLSGFWIFRDSLLCFFTANMQTYCYTYIISSWLKLFEIPKVLIFMIYTPLNQEEDTQ